MARSMTAYGTGSVATPLGRFTVEIQSINKRYFDLQCLLPPPLVRFEAKVRGLVSAAVHRGQLLYRLQIAYTGAGAIQLRVDDVLLLQLKDVWQHVATHLGHDATAPLPLELFTTRPDLFVQEESLADEESHWLGIAAATETALHKLLQLKCLEGSALTAVMAASAHRLTTCLVEIEILLPQAVVKYRQRLQDKLSQAISASPDLLNDERLLREVFLFADKVDVSEEIARLKSHLVQLNTLVNDSTGHIGKQLEFLLQEITREINTLGVKCSDIAVIQLTLAMKGEVEKIREQVQNVE